jgi:hypothetical protein
MFAAGLTAHSCGLGMELVALAWPLARLRAARRSA